MSLRRSTRITADRIEPIITRPVIVKKDTVKKERVVNKESVNKERVKKERVKKEGRKDTHIPPDTWPIVFDKIRTFREHVIAPVDTMGCERLADKEAPAEVIFPGCILEYSHLYK